MSGARDLICAGFTRTPANERRVLPRDCALAKNVIRPFQKAVQFQSHARKTPKHSMQVRHQQRRGHAFARHIAEQKHELPIAIRWRYQVAIISAHEAGRLILIVNSPVLKSQVRLRQQSTLDFPRQLHIAFQRALLTARKMVEAESDKRISQQALFLRRFIAGRADAVRSVIHPLQCGVHFAKNLQEWLRESRRLGGRNCGSQFGPPLFELFAQIRIGYFRHGNILQIRGSRRSRGGAIRFGHGNSSLCLFYLIPQLGPEIPQLPAPGAAVRTFAQALQGDARNAPVSADKPRSQWLPAASPFGVRRAHRVKSTLLVAARLDAARNKSRVVRKLQIPRANFPPCLPTSPSPANDRLRAWPSVPASALLLYPTLEATHLPQVLVRNAYGPALPLPAARIFAKVQTTRIRLFLSRQLRTAALRCGSKGLPAPSDPFDCAEKSEPAAPAALRAENQNIFRV